MAVRPRPGRLARRCRLTGVDLSEAQLAEPGRVPEATYLHADLTTVEFEHARSTPSRPSTRSTTCPRAARPAVRAHPRVAPVGRAAPHDARRERRARLDGRFLGAPSFFSGYPPETNRRLLDEAGSPSSRRARHDPRARGRRDVPLGPGPVMSCAFSLDHYGELLEAARAGGYRFAGFESPPQPGDLLLRHDVDLSLDAALRMAELEAEAGATATYFLMTESVFYNLASKEGVEALARLRALGHRVGLHAVYPHATLDGRFDPVVAWHNPDPEYMTAPIDGAVNAMQEGLVRPLDVPLGLEPAVAVRLPPTTSCARGIPLAPAPHAPRDLGLSGRHDGTDDAGDARRRAGAPPDAAGRGQDRPGVSLRPVTVLVSASGAPGTAALLRALRENGEREVRLVGTDMSERSVGRHLCDAFHLVPAGSDPASGRGARDRRARGRGRRPAAVVVRPRGPLGRIASGSPCPFSCPLRTRSTGRTTRRRRTPSSTGSAPPRPRSARQRRRRGRGGGARARLPRPARLLQAGLLVRARAGSASSTRRSTARTSSCTSGPARSRCASRRPSSCSPTRAGRTCS